MSSAGPGECPICLRRVRTGTTLCADCRRQARLEERLAALNRDGQGHAILEELERPDLASYGDVAAKFGTTTTRVRKLWHGRHAFLEAFPRSPR